MNLSVSTTGLTKSIVKIYDGATGQVKTVKRGVIDNEKPGAYR